MVDRYQLWIHPVAVGAGKRLFNEAVALRPMHSTSTPTGVTILELEPETATAAIRRA